jgi:tetratricopeptide (TPR) repeat protein
LNAATILTERAALPDGAKTGLIGSVVKQKGKLNPYPGPDPVTIEIRRIGSLLERNDLAAAEAQALKLLKAHPRRPDVHNIMGVIYIRQGIKNIAVPHLEFAVEAEPENILYLSNLGRLYVDLGFVELALQFLHKALAIDPNFGSALSAVGMYYNQIGKAELALPYLERLIKITPQDDRVKFELAESFAALGRSDEAGKLYRELRKTKSHLVSALYYFSRHGPPEEDAALVREIEALQSHGTLTGEVGSKLHRALGFIHEREGNYPLAFTHFDRANRLLPVEYDIENYRAWVDGIIDVFTADVFRKRANIGIPSSLPVLVVGMPRSGTTLTEQMIASHGQAGGAGELSRIEFFAMRLHFGQKLDISKFMAAFDALGSKGLRERGNNYVDLLKFHAPKAQRIVDKMPHNFQYLGFAALMCPNVRIIHCSRNPADTCWSCFQNPMNDHHAYSRDLTRLGLYYREYKRLIEHWKAVLPVPIYELRYENITADFENEARKVIEFIGLPWDEACLKFHEAGRTVHTFSKQQVRSPIYKSSIERWRNYEKELQPLLSALGDLV